MKLINQDMKGSISNVKQILREDYILILPFILHILNLLKITTNEMWYDEAMTGIRAFIPLGKALVHINSSWQAPLYTVIIHFWTKVFGLSDFNLRLFSWVCGLLTLFVIQKLLYNLLLARSC